MSCEDLFSRRVKQEKGVKKLLDKSSVESCPSFNLSLKMMVSRREEDGLVVARADWRRKHHTMFFLRRVDFFMGGDTDILK